MITADQLYMDNNNHVYEKEVIYVKLQKAVCYIKENRRKNGGLNNVMAAEGAAVAARGGSTEMMLFEET